MADQDKIHEQYISGFNQGYLLARHLPELAEKLTKIEGKSDRVLGMKEGIEQYVLEQSKDRTPDWLKKDRLGKTDDKLNDKSKDNLERE